MVELRQRNSLRHVDPASGFPCSLYVLTCLISWRLTSIYWPTSRESWRTGRAEEERRGSTLCVALKRSKRSPAASGLRRRERVVAPLTFDEIIDHTLYFLPQFFSSPELATFNVSWTRHSEFDNIGDRSHAYVVRLLVLLHAQVVQSSPFKLTSRVRPWSVHRRGTPDTIGIWLLAMEWFHPPSERLRADMHQQHHYALLDAGDYLRVSSNNVRTRIQLRDSLLGNWNWRALICLSGLERSCLAWKVMYIANHEAKFNCAYLRDKSCLAQNTQLRDITASFTNPYASFTT